MIHRPYKHCFATSLYFRQMKTYLVIYYVNFLFTYKFLAIPFSQYIVCLDWLIVPIVTIIEWLMSTLPTKQLRHILVPKHSYLTPTPNPYSPIPGQNGPHFADDIFRCIFVKWKFCIFIKIALKFIPMRPIDHNPAMVYLWLGAE